jgi:hypothetical protein
MSRIAACVLLGVACALALPAGTGATVDKATIIVNQGAAGITLGMTRAEVVAVLGKPLYENNYGYMEYSKKSLFDVYRSGSRTGKVDMIGISGPGFCLRNGICMLRRGNVGELKKKFGKQLSFQKLEDGTLLYRIYGTFRGRRAYTEFDVDSRADSARIGMIWVGFVR